MKRNIDINEISDGKRYGLNDLVKADCADCSGCSACCRGMGNTIVLDPWDLFQLCTNYTLYKMMYLPVFPAKILYGLTIASSSIPKSHRWISSPSLKEYRIFSVS